MERKEVRFDYEEGDIEPVKGVSNRVPKLTDEDLETMHQAFINEYVMRGEMS